MSIAELTLRVEIPGEYDGDNYIDGLVARIEEFNGVEVIDRTDPG